MKRISLLFFFVILDGFMTYGISTGREADSKMKEQRVPGLVGMWYGSADLKRPKGSHRLTSLTIDLSEMSWGNDWSAHWQGSIWAPVNGEVTFKVKSNDAVVLHIDGRRVIDLLREDHMASGTVSFIRNKIYPLTVTYHHPQAGPAHLDVQWSSAGKEFQTLPIKSFFHTLQQELEVNFETPIATPEQVASLDRSIFLTVPCEHYIVYYDSERFAGWPANNGIWAWGDEIVVGFTLGSFKEEIESHSIDDDQPSWPTQARSLDGGQTWTLEKPEGYHGDGGQPVFLKNSIDFTDPDFSLRCADDRFYISYDRARTWQGPYLFPDIWQKLTSRTDYLINNTRDALLFLSARDGNLPDQAFTAHLKDGGREIDFLSWMTPNSRTIRSVMPSAIRIDEQHLVSALRRRQDSNEESCNWIDVYESWDDGKSWHFLSKVTATDRGGRNGNPPSMVKLNDGRLCVTYGYRAFPFGIRARISADKGQTWSEEIHLRDDGRTWDVGYTQTVQRKDGKLVTLYYYTNHEYHEQHIAATIWEPTVQSEE